MNYAMLFLAIALVVMLILGLRTMQEDHLFSIGHQVETGIWAMFAFYIFTITFMDVHGDLMKGVSIDARTTSMVQLILVGIMVSRLLSTAAFTLGNPPKVRIAKNPQDDSLKLSPVTGTPGVVTDSDGGKRMVL